MEEAPEEVKGWSQQALFSHTRAAAISLVALVDPDDRTVVFTVTAVAYPTKELVALWSSSPIGFEEHAVKLDQALAEFSQQVWDKTGPF